MASPIISIPNNPAGQGNPLTPITGTPVGQTPSTGTTITSAAGLASQDASAAQGFTNAGAGIINAEQAYLQPLLTGDRTAVTQDLAPQINAVSSQYDAAFKALNKQNPRSGGSISSSENLMASKAGAISDTITSARSQAAQQESSLAGQVLSFASGESSISASTLSSIISSELAKSGQDAAAFGSLGGGIGSIIGGLIAA